MMNLLFVIHYPVFGGPHNQALQLNGALHARGWSTLVVVPDEPGSAASRLRNGGVEVRQLRLDRLRSKVSLRLQLRFLSGFIPGVRRIRDQIRSREIDLVMVAGLVNPHAAIAARLERKPVVWQLVDVGTPRALVRLMMPIVTRLADSILVTGKEVAQAHPGAEEFQERLVSYFPPVDIHRFRMRPEIRREARVELGFAEDDFVVGSVSNFNPLKNQVAFVEAAAALRKEVPKARFVIFGATYPDHADYVDRIVETADELGLKLGSDLVFHDPGSEVARYASTLDIFWLTSRSEGIPTVVEEAMALGLPVVSTDVGSVRRAVENGSTGFVVSPDDPNAMARPTAELLLNDSLRAEFGERARSRASAEFSVERCADAHVRAFDAAILHARARLKEPRSDG